MVGIDGAIFFHTCIAKRNLQPVSKITEFIEKEKRKQRKKEILISKTGLPSRVKITLVNHH